MVQANVSFDGDNYFIKIPKFGVKNLQSYRDDFKRMIRENGGVCNNSESGHTQKHSEVRGYWNIWEFMDDYFSKGNLVGISGETMKNGAVYVKPMGRDEMTLGFMVDHENDPRFEPRFGIRGRYAEPTDPGFVRITVTGYRPAASGYKGFSELTGLPEPSIEVELVPCEKGK